MHITSKNFTTVMKTDGQSVRIRGNFKVWYSVVIKVKKTSSYRRVLTHENGERLRFPSKKEALIYLLKNCGYQGPVIDSGRAFAVLESLQRLEDSIPF